MSPTRIERTQVPRSPFELQIQAGVVVSAKPPFKQRRGSV
jgi:hypothetical protein